jgi:cardiolipin synthase
MWSCARSNRKSTISFHAQLAKTMRDDEDALEMATLVSAAQRIDNLIHHRRSALGRAALSAAPGLKYHVGDVVARYGPVPQNHQPLPRSFIFRERSIMTHSLLVFPDDTAQCIVDPIRAAKRSLNIRMFLFTDPTLLHEVIAAKQRGVTVRVMLNPARRNGESENDETAATLAAAGVEVRDSNPAFALTHQKSMVIDDEIGFVESLNWETRDLTETRDYAVTTTNKLEVSEMVDCFDADWAQQDFVPNPDSQLIWCPNNGRERIGAFIDSAKRNALDPERALSGHGYHRATGPRRAARRRGPHHGAAAAQAEEEQADRGHRRTYASCIDVGAKVHRLNDMKLHGKMLLADEERAIVGSINLTPGSFDDRRELAIETDARHVVERLVHTSHHDWKHSRKLDLSDEAVQADLEKHGVRQ